MEHQQGESACGGATPDDLKDAVCSRADDRRALEAVHRKYGDAVYAMTHHICRSHRAPQVVAEVFLDLCSESDSTDGAGVSLPCILLSVCYQRSPNALSDQDAERRRTEGMMDQDDRPHRQSGDVSDWQVPYLSALPEDERTAIAVVLYGQATYRDAATLLGIDGVSARNLIQSGMCKLRHHVEGPALAKRLRSPTRCPLGTASAGSGSDDPPAVSNRQRHRRRRQRAQTIGLRRKEIQR